MAPKVARITSTQETFVQSKNVSESSSKARWNDSNTETFLKVCVGEVEAGNRPHTHFIKDGWTNIVDKFNNITRKNYDKKQLKNRWDALKHEFSMWAKLVENETGLGWDSVKNTIMAPHEWWEAKGKDNIILVEDIDNCGKGEPPFDKLYIDTEEEDYNDNEVEEFG
ncbi:hypothetical protein K1719_002673 [Acacia pycnantha]|nr:hypothetical protein K1719_002673 [Acacia pycnantha]